MSTLVLIDGNSLAYRAFFALPDTMKTSKGILTNALYGFTSMLLKIIEESPDYIILTFDRPTPTFRHKEYKEYKATREKAPDKLREQIPWVRKISEAFGIPIYELDGFEADDLIGTLAKKAEKEGLDVEILTGDLDTTQLVSPHIKVVTTKKGISDTVVYDEKEVENKFGLKPQQVVDFKGLKGDPSDNIPGVPGIGEKTAVALLKEFGTVENVLRNIDKIKSQKTQAALSNHKDLALLSKRLASIIEDVPLEIDFSKLKKFEVNWNRVLPLFEELEFKSLIKRFAEKADKDVITTVDKKKEKLTALKLDYQIVDTEKGIEELIQKLREVRVFALDTETTSLNTFEAELVGISICCEANKACYIPIHNSQFTIHNFKSILEDPEILKYGQNIKYDAEVLANYGIKLNGIAFDTMVAAYLLDPAEQKYNLKFMGKRYLDRDMITFEEVVEESNLDITKVEVSELAQYACADADVTFQLVNIFESQLKEKGLYELFSQIEMPLVSVLIEMELAGVFVDSIRLKELSHDLTHKIKRLETEIFAMAGETFNLNSPKQLAEVLFNKLKLPISKRTKTGPSTDASVLEKLAPKFEMARKLLEYRTYAKVKSTYIDVLPELINKKTGRVHTSFNQTITATGRLSSSNPNLQNIPLKGELGEQIRKTFVPQKDGWAILAADYSQVELRILAHLSRDPELVKAFDENKDIHRATAAQVYGIPEEEVTTQMRSSAKAVNFGIIYGMSEYGLAKQIGVGREQAAWFIDKYFEKHKGVKAFIDKTLEDARKCGYVTTLLGRRRYLPQIESPNRTEREFSERIAINTPVQGTAADIIKAAMIEINSKLKAQNSRLPDGQAKTKMILQVHDELVFEVPQAEIEAVKELVEDAMINAVPLSVPIKVDIGIGKSWGEAK